MSRVGIIDYGSGNFTSVWNAVNAVSSNVQVISETEHFDNCTHLILPGVGAYASAMKKLELMAIIDKLRNEVFQQKKHFLGICVGMQILTDRGEEFDTSKGLEFVNGKSIQLDIDTKSYSLPHMGWNSVLEKENSPLFTNMDKEASFYFLHSYEVILENPDIKPVLTEYGKKFTAAFSFNNIHGVQFHPEKSQYYGLKLLENFICL